MGGGGSATTCSRAQLPPASPATPRTSAQGTAPGQRSNASSQHNHHRTDRVSHLFLLEHLSSQPSTKSDQEVSQYLYSECTVSPVGKLLTRVFPPCPNSIANLFFPQLVFTSSTRTNLFLSGSYFAIIKERGTPLSPFLSGFALIPLLWAVGSYWGTG